jgi:hypothetical protein
MGIDHPAIKRIKRAGDQKQPVAKVPEFGHSRAMMMNPNPTASANLKRSTIT